MNDTAAVVLTSTAVVGALITWWKWVRPRWVLAKVTIREFRDAVLGRPPILHPDTGDQILPAVPGIGARQANIEGQLGDLTKAVAALAYQGQRLDDHERRLGALEEMREERTLARTETVELLRVMDTAMKTPPPKPED